MKTKYNVVCSLCPRDRVFIRNISRSIAEKVKLQLAIGHDIIRRIQSNVVIHRRISTSHRNGFIPRNYTVYLKHFSFPFITHLTRSEAIKVRDALARLFKVKSFVRYWHPGTAGEFMKPCK
jgi:hypothetical protein